jgi:DNA-binding SARP family transcriptional activator
MNSLRVCLFGRFEVQLENQGQTGVWTRRAQELLCYLVLHRTRQHPREALIDTLWSDNPPAQSRKQLRQALWEMQTALPAVRSNNEFLCLAEADWISVNPNCGVWFDVADFEQACGCAHHTPGELLDAECANSLQYAVDLYRGDLLEGWYQDWCLYERERLQNLYLDMLDKLMAYCEYHQYYEVGMGYGAKILKYDRARERTHWRLMRLYYLANDRAGALRQFQRCVIALEQELGVKPSQRTLALLEQIRTDRALDLNSLEETTKQPISFTALPRLVERLKLLRVTVSDLQHQIDLELRALEDTTSD